MSETQILELSEGQDTVMLTLEEQGRMVGDVRERSQRMSTLDGFTIHRRKARRPRIHLLRPVSARCLQNVPSEMIEQVEGSRELVLDAIAPGGGLPCPKCFPKEESDD